MCIYIYIYIFIYISYVHILLYNFWKTLKRNQKDLFHLLHAVKFFHAKFYLCNFGTLMVKNVIQINVKLMPCQ